MEAQRSLDTDNRGAAEPEFGAEAQVVQAEPTF